jgi:hypothetical protein
MQTSGCYDCQVKPVVTRNFVLEFVDVLRYTQSLFDIFRGIRRFIFQLAEVTEFKLTLSYFSEPFSFDV